MPVVRARRSRHRPPDDTGAAAVEFALVLVLFLTLVFGIIQYGYYFYQSQAASSTVREASRLAAVGISDCTTFRTSAVAAAAANGLGAGSNPTVTAAITGGSSSAAEIGDNVTVTFAYEPAVFGLPFLPFPFTGGDADTKTSQARVEAVGAPGVTTCS